MHWGEGDVEHFYAAEALKKDYKQELLAQMKEKKERDSMVANMGVCCTTPTPPHKPPKNK